MDAEQAATLRQIIEKAKRELISRYDLIHSAMRGEFMSAIYSAQVPSTKAQITVDRRLFDIGREASKTERQIVTSISEEIHRVAQGVETPEMIVSLLTFQNDIVRQVSRDARAVSRLFRQVQVSLDSLSRDKHLPAKAQALQHVSKPGVFTYRDKAGKIWDTKVYLKTAGSKYYYGLANDIAIDSIHSQGRESATLDRPSHPSNGLEINLAEIDAEMESKFFHPGSQGILI